MKAFKIFSMAAVAFMMVACSSEDTVLDNTPIAGQKVHFTATIAAPGSDALTRTTYTEITSGTDAGKIKVAWEQGDKIALIHNGKKDEVTVQTLNADGSANISGDITVGTDGEAVTIVYPAASVNAPTSGAEPVEDATYATKWNSQDGTLTYIQDNLDFCRATSTLKVSGTKATLNDNISMGSTIAIFKFTTKNFDASATIKGKPLTITIGTQDYVITPASATSELYVALPAVSGQTVSFSGTVGSMPWLCSKTGVSFDAGNFYQSTLKMLPQGAIPGRFTINAGGDKVYFSQGNLQAIYDGSAWSWAFATNQWDFIGGRSSGGSETQTGNNFISGNGTMSTAGTVDLFGWVGETSTILTSDPAKYGISNSNTHSDYGVSVTDKLMSDWGNIMGSGWRTLSSAEWNYLFTSRTDANQKFGFGSINGVNGLIILPDSWTLPAGLTFTAGNSAWGNGYTTDEWSLMETAGAVFLPAAGGRLKNASGPYLYGIPESGIYWSSSPKADNVNNAMRLWFCVHEGSTYLVPQDSNDRYNGYSVRLVRDAE